MALIRWNPAADLLNIHSELDHVFDRMFQGGLLPRYGDGSAVTFLPVDIHRGEGTIVIEASVPGFKPEEVDITVDGGLLTIQATHEETTEAAEPDFIRRERQSGTLYRQIALGEQVDGEKAEAAFADGVLTVTVPMVAKPEPKRIRITAGTTVDAKK